MTVQIPLYLQKKLTPARADRQMVADIFSAGVVKATDLAVSSAGTVRGITIAPGAAYIPGTQVAYQGTYRFFSDTAVSLTLDPASTNPRVDQIFLRIQDSAENGNVGLDTATIEIAKGAESAGATLANRTGAVTDASMPPNWFRLADVLITPGIAAVPTANVSDRRTLSPTRPIQGTLAQRPSASIGQGVFYYATDNSTLYLSTGTGWVSIYSALETSHIVGTSGQPPLGAGWGGSYTNALRYWKDQTGRVYLAGKSLRSSGSAEAFTLPVGYRPINAPLTTGNGVNFPVVSAGGTVLSICYIENDGKVYHSAANGSDASFESVSFHPGQ